MSAELDVAIATASTLSEPDSDEPALLAKLTALGLSARAIAWDDPRDGCAAAKLVVIRSTWNYLHHYQTFLDWCDRIGPRLLNPPEVVRWNIHKGYLLEIAQRGHSVVPTELLRRGETADLGEILNRRGWANAVVKPAISAGSFSTRKVSRSSLDDEGRAAFAQLVAERDVLIQPYVRSVEGYGERSLIMIDGQITHAIRKSPRFEGSEESVTGPLPIAPDERRAATGILAVGREKGPLLYGRVDLARDDAGTPMLMELELIEPSLFLDKSSEALERLSRAILARVRA